MTEQEAILRIKDHIAIHKYEQNAVKIFEALNMAISALEKQMTDKERENYCKDCDRSIYGKYPSCDINIENNGMYVMSDSKCYCKITNGERAEKYPWEGES